jgi:hypothetical protein
VTTFYVQLIEDSSNGKKENIRLYQALSHKIFVFSLTSQPFKNMSIVDSMRGIPKVQESSWEERHETETRTVADPRGCFKVVLSSALES